MKKNARSGERERLLKMLEDSDISEDGKVGTISLSNAKVKRWRREIARSFEYRGKLDILDWKT